MIAVTRETGMYEINEITVSHKPVNQVKLDVYLQQEK